MLFDDVVNAPSPFISYTAGTGTFSITQPGTYYVSWWVAINGTEGSSFGEFSLLVNGSGGVAGISPIVTGIAVGSAVITTASASSITLANTTGEIVLYADTPVQANLSIVAIE